MAKKNKKEIKPDLQEKGISSVGAYYLTHNNVYGEIIPYNPDELLINKGYNVYNKMMLDDAVKSGLGLKKGAILSRSFFFDTGKEEVEQMDKMADFFTFVLDNIKGSFIDALSGILTALEHGYSITEKIYENIQWDNKAYWGIKSFKTRPFETFDNGIISDKHGNVKYFKQFTHTGEEAVLEKDKVIHFVNDPNISPLYGQSDLKGCYREYWHKDITIKFQSIHLERSAGGFLYASVSAPLSSDEDTALKNLITNVSAATGAALPDSVKLEAFQPLRTEAYEKAVSQYNKAIVRSLLVPNLIGVAEQTNTGSFAQAEVQLKAFFWTLLSLSRALEEVLNEQLFRQLALWNFGTDVFPKFKFEPLTQQEKIEYVKTWADLTQKKVVKNIVEDEQYIRRILNFTELSEEEVEKRKKEEVEKRKKDAIIIKNQPIEQKTAQPDDGDGKQDNNRMFSIAGKRLMLNKSVNYSEIAKELDGLERPYIKGLTNAMAEVKTSLEEQITAMFFRNKGINTSNIPPEKIMKIKVPKSNVKDVISKSLNSALKKGSRSAKKEMPSKAVINKKKKENADYSFPDKYPSDTLDFSSAENFLNVKSLLYYSNLTGALESGVHNVLLNSIKYNKSLAETMMALEADIVVSSILPDATGSSKPFRLYSVARTAIADAYNQGRQAFFTQPDLKDYIQAFQYSSVLDESTTEICKAMHGRILKTFGSYAPVNHMGCRSLLIPVTVLDNWNGKENNLPTSVRPQVGFM